MEPPPKRLRLSLFDQNTVGIELDTARHNNDMTLKNRFEYIFAKYAKDFTGIGDEIDLMTGEIVVNNGHLESMEAETDPGLNHRAGDFTSAGRSMLRAMTVTLNPDLPGPDDVLMSIESIAENAALADDDSTAESSDDLFDTSRVSSQTRSESTSNKSYLEQSETNIEPYNSDSDSLFEGDNRRSASVDSLFAHDNTDVSGIRDGSQSQYRSYISPDPIPLCTNSNDDNEIIARFGPHVGKEVLHLIGQRQEAHVEPAWRIPVRLDPATVHQSTPLMAASSPVEESPKANRNQSLWKIPKQSRKRLSRSDTPMQQTREESIDPLQDDSFGESDTSSQARSDGEMAYVDQESEEEDESVQHLLAQVSVTGDCPYCDAKFRDKTGVMAHWDRVLKQFSKRAKEDDPHDIALIERIRASAAIRIRLPRLVVYDFRTMVELHEGAGMSFDEIAASKTLRTRKTGLQLQENYNKHRTPPAWNNAEEPVRKWTVEEDNVLQGLCKNPIATMATLRRGLKHRDELEIGNHLAELWLMQLGKARVPSGPASHIVHNHNAIPSSAVGPSGGNTMSCEEGPSKPLEVKQEESEDELFIA